MKAASGIPVARRNDPYLIATNKCRFPIAYSRTYIDLPSAALG
jgi:hypothetical protein